MSSSLIYIHAHFPRFGFSLLAFLLGMRHGLDLDHLAMIDAITRRLSDQSRLSNLVGLLFSLGHGLVVILFCALIHSLLKKFFLPIWLGNMMIALSIIFLIVFGVVNFYSFFQQLGRKRLRCFSPVILSKRGLGVTAIDSPLFIMLIGGIFAISFDTVSQLTLFSINASPMIQGFFPVLLAGFLFMLGMMLVDGVNGFLISAFVRKASKFSSILSQIFTFGIGFFSAFIGVYEILQLI